MPKILISFVSSGGRMNGILTNTGFMEHLSANPELPHEEAREYFEAGEPRGFYIVECPDILLNPVT